MAILQSSYKIPQPRGYANKTYYIEDTSPASPFYFDVEDFPIAVGGGRHIIKIKGNGLNMRLNTPIDVEFIDAQGQRIFVEVLNYTDRFNNFYIAFEIYDITARGIATAYFVGEALFDQKGTPVPTQFRDIYNVRWSKQFSVQPFERNNAELIFDNPPQVGVVQVSVPARVRPLTAGGNAYKFITYTGSIDEFTIVDTSFEGYDRDFQSSANILDSRTQTIRIDPLGQPSMINSVPTARRSTDTDIFNGFYINNTTRFTTRLISTSSFFSKELVGAFFEFFDSASAPQSLSPVIPAGYSISGSLSEQLALYQATIVEVVNTTQAILDTKLSVNVVNNNTVSPNTQVQFTYKNASTFTGSFTYVPTITNFITSSVVNDSYIEFTFTDLKPLSGEVYRIRTSTKFSDIVGDYKLLNDQIIRPVEYLTDAEYPNGIYYTRRDSDYRLIGHFTTQSILDTYWQFYHETPSGFDIVSGSINSIVQSEAAFLRPNFTQSLLFTTRYNQNYNEKQTYTLSAFVTLGPYTELEVYMNSDVLNTHLSIPQLYPKGFTKSTNIERSRYRGDYSRFGKYLGKITNDRPITKYYGRVMFDFETDASGFGNPLFRAKIIDEMNMTGSAYLSEVSIKPFTLNGFTPSIVQYAVPLPQDLLDASALSQSIDIKIEYLDYTGNQSEYVTFLNDVLLNFETQIAANTCQDDKLQFIYNSANTSIPTQALPPAKG